MSETNSPETGNNAAPQIGPDFARFNRRAALRRIGITTGATFLGLFAADDLARLAIAGLERHRATQGIAAELAREFNGAGVAYAQGGTYHCGVRDQPCITCGTPGDPGGDGLAQDNPGCPCGDGWTMPCLECNVPDSNCDCMDVADYKFCCCQRAAINTYPCCVDCAGHPLGSPSCNCTAFNAAIDLCGSQYRADSQACV